MTLDVTTRPLGNGQADEKAGADSLLLPDQGRGWWMQTRHGGRFYVLNPRAEDVCIEDIAWALSMLCRFGGHVTRFYSVAEHCVRCSYIVEPGNELIGLLHDSGEAFCQDLITPVKQLFPGYKTVENGIVAAIDARFALSGRLVNEPPDVKRADLIMLATEHRDLMAPGPGHEHWNLQYAPLPKKIRPWSPDTARKRFIARFNELMKKAA